MKEERGISRGVTGTDQPEVESKAKRCIRIAIGCVGLGFILYVCVMAFLRRQGG